jgi:hypothetical protein
MYDEAHSLHSFHDAKRIERIKKKCSKYLDSCDMRMPEPLFKFNIDDITTWKWIQGKSNDPLSAEGWTVPNPEFKYAHLSPYPAE